MLNYWRHSLSVRLWFTSVAALAIGLSVIAAVILYSLNHFPPQIFRGESDMRDARNIAASVGFDNAGRPNALKVAEEIAWLYEVLPTELMYRVMDDTGRVVFASRDAYHGDPWLPGKLAAVTGQIKPAKIDGRLFDVVTLKIQHQQSTFFVQTATSVEIDKAVLMLKVSPIPGTVQTTVLVAMIIFGLTLTFTVRRVLKPLTEASKAAASITPRNLTARLSTEGVPSEIKPLIHAFNEALGRLQHGFAVQQKFLASAAHELQTPLTLLRGQIELQPEIDDKELLYREIDLMARQVRQLLHLAEVSETQNFSFSQVSIADEAMDVVEYLARKAENKQVKLSFDTSIVSPQISADKSALFILLKNMARYRYLSMRRR